MTSNLVPLVEELKRQVTAAVDEIKSDPRMEKILSLHHALNTLEESCELPKTPLIELFGFKDGSTVVIGPTEFYGLKPLDAAKRFLRKKGKDGSTVDEVLNALHAGGCETSTSDEKDLRMGLSRSTLDLAKVGDRYCLLEFLPHIKRGKKGKSSDKRAESGIAPSTEVGEPEETDKETASE